ncbi:hypothetical protein Tco_0209389 [Tanacetum coccineum]
MKIVIEQKLNPTVNRVTTDVVEFYQTLKEEMVADLRYFKSLKNEVESLQSQLELQQTQFSNEIDRLSKEYYYADHMNAILGVYTTLVDYSDMSYDYLETLKKCERLENEISKQTKNAKNKSFNEWSERRIVALESTIQKPKSTFRRLYEHVSKTCSWKLTLPGYKWEPKSKIGNADTNVSLPLGTKYRTTNISEPRSIRGFDLSNTPLSSNSFASHRNYPIHRRLWVHKAHDGKSHASKIWKLLFGNLHVIFVIKKAMIFSQALEEQIFTQTLFKK